MEDMTQNASLECKFEALKRANDDLRWENAALREEIAKLRASSHPLRFSSMQQWTSSSSVPSSALAEKSYMRPTRASRFRQAAGGQGHDNSPDTHRAGTTIAKRAPNGSISPDARRRKQGHKTDPGPDSCKGKEEISTSVPRYMKHTASSHQKRGGPHSPSQKDCQNRKLHEKQPRLKSPVSPSAFDDSLWQRLQQRTEQPVVTGGSQEPAAGTASPSLLVSSIGSRDTVLAGTTVAENSPTLSTM
ncbi:hypothetical protein VTH06DRAFT_6892 [Thermothelomyces fergusii]